MFSTIILMCLASIKPEDCTSQNALNRIRGPEASLEQCMMLGETIVAARPNPFLGKQYIKVTCMDTREVSR